MTTAQSWNGVFAKNATKPIVLLMILFAGALKAQDHSNFTHFFINPYVLNPSYAGLDGQPSASLIYRKQWMTIDGAPTITNLSLHAPFNNRVSAGINVNNDSKGFFNNSALLFSVAYHLPLHDWSFVRFGLSAGGSWNTVDMKKLENINDQALGNILDNHASLSGNAGVSFHHKTFNFGISLPAIFSPAYVSEDAFNVEEVKPFQSMIIHGTNRFYFGNNKHIFEPYILYHLNTELPSQFEIAGIVHLNQVVWAGVSHRQYFGVSALGGVKLKNSLAIGASYSIQQSGMDELNSPSFEVSASYLFGKQKRNAPVYSFVNAVKPKDRTQTARAKNTQSWRQKQVERERQRRDEAAKLRAEQEEKRELAADETRKKQVQDEEKKASPPARHDEGPPSDVPLEQPEERPRQQVTEDRREEGIKPTGLQPNDAPVARPVEETHPNREQTAVVVERVPEDESGLEREQLQRLEDHAADPGRTVEEAIRNDVRHETFRRGNHPEELDASEYVVVGVFKSIENAKHFIDGLRTLKFDSQFGYLTPTNLWYVYILKTNDSEKARSEQQRVSKLFLLRDAWLLTVTPE